MSRRAAEVVVGVVRGGGGGGRMCVVEVVVVVVKSCLLARSACVRALVEVLPQVTSTAQLRVGFECRTSPLLQYSLCTTNVSFRLIRRRWYYGQVDKESVSGRRLLRTLPCFSTARYRSYEAGSRCVRLCRRAIEPVTRLDGFQYRVWSNSFPRIRGIAGG